MGLGLYIVKTIMHLHGGDITASSVVDEYCSFTLWLPRDKSQAKKNRFNRKKGGNEAADLSDKNKGLISAEAEEHSDED